MLPPPLSSDPRCAAPRSRPAPSLARLTAEVLGEVACAQGDRARARTWLTEAVLQGRSLRDITHLAMVLLALGRLLLEEEERAQALAHFREAERLLRDRRWSEPSCLPAAYLALLGEGDPRSVVVPDNAIIGAGAEAHLVLHRAGAGGDHLERARELVGRMCAHLVGPDLEQFWLRSPLGRMLRAEEDRMAGRG